MDATVVDTLIALVAERPTIWNKMNQNHSCRLKVEKAWKEIGQALNIDENTLRKKWKYLRDQFCVELGKMQTSVTGVPKWRHFKALEFLRSTVTPRIYGKGDENYGDDSDIEVDEQSSSDYFERLSPKVEAKKKPKLENSKKKKKTTKKKSVKDSDSVSDNIFEDENEHLLFFKSILPHVRKIPESKLLSFRSRMQCLVEEFAYGPNPTSAEFVPGIPIKGSPPRYSSETCDPIDTSE